jgi:hypothetical protein
MLQYSRNAQVIAYGAVIACAIAILAIAFALPYAASAQESPVIMRSVDPRFGIVLPEDWENPPVVPDDGDIFGTLDPEDDPFNTVSPDEWANPPVVPEDGDIFGTLDPEDDPFNTVLPDEWANPPQIMSSGDERASFNDDTDGNVTHQSSGSDSASIGDTSDHKSYTQSSEDRPRIF